MPSYVRYLKRNGERSITVIYRAVFPNSFPVDPSREGTTRTFSLSQSVYAQSHASRAAFVVLGAITFCHLLNDVMQALLPAIYPMLKSGFALSFGQIGLLTLIFQVTASLLQPIVGLYTDRRPQPYSLPVGMACSLLGMVTLAFTPSFSALLAGAALLGIGSSIFHPESSRLARLASGGAHGFAQSFFQVGGHVGSALGPLLAAFVVLPQGRGSIAWFALAALLGICILAGVYGRYKSPFVPEQRSLKFAKPHHPAASQVRLAMAVLIALIFSKFFYLASITSDYTFYLIHRFGLSIETAKYTCLSFSQHPRLACSSGGRLAIGLVARRLSGSR